MSSQIKIYLAPFQGITTNTFRTVYEQHFSGLDKLYTPYFSKIKDGSPLSNKQIKELGSQQKLGTEIVPQILSNNANEILWFAHNCELLGFKEINWNLGCPYPMVANRKLGSGLLPHQELVHDILKNVMTRIKLRLSIKCRLGYYNPEEINSLIPIFNHYPIHELIIHARTGKQLYSGETNLEAVKNIGKTFSGHLVYNGDILNSESKNHVKALVPEINDFMIGRGILVDPFLAMRIKQLALPSNPKKHIQQFVDNLYYAYRKAKNDDLTLLNILKDYWTYLAYSFTDPIKVLRKIKKCNSFDSYEDNVNAVFMEHELLD